MRGLKHVRFLSGLDIYFIVEALYAGLLLNTDQKAFSKRTFTYYYKLKSCLDFGGCDFSFKVTRILKLCEL